MISNWLPVNAQSRLVKVIVSVAFWVTSRVQFTSVPPELHWRLAGGVTVIVCCFALVPPWPSVTVSVTVKSVTTVAL